MHNASLICIILGSVACWGMGTSKQLGNGDEDDAWIPTKMGGKQLNER